VFENLAGAKKIWRQVNPSHFTKFRKIRRNLEKFSRNVFDERKEHDFFKTRKSAEFVELSAESVDNSVMNSEFDRTRLNNFK
jgi:hypothetical protein